jgi:hypothetical protein
MNMNKGKETKHIQTKYKKKKIVYHLNNNSIHFNSTLVHLHANLTGQRPITM